MAHTRLHGVCYGQPSGQWEFLWVEGEPLAFCIEQMWLECLFP